MQGSNTSSTIGPGRAELNAGTSFIPAIEGLRGVAILIVMTSHLGYGNIVPGGFGVTLFFFISGFLITRLLIAECEQTGGVSLKRFYLRRFVRLAPALLAMVTVVSCVYAVFGAPPTSSEISAAVFYYINYFVLFGGAMTLPFGALWSLAVEEHYYLIFPAALRSLWRRPRLLILSMVALLIAVLLWRCCLVFIWHATADRTYIATDTRIDSIIFGAFLAAVLDQRRAAFWFLTRPAAILIGISLLFASFLIRNETFRETARYSLQGIGLLPLFCAAVFAPRWGWARRVLTWPTLLWVGRLSYSLYLWHLPVIFFLGFAEPHWSDAARRLSSIAAFTALAVASYYCLERPLTGLRKRLHGRSRYQRGAPLAKEPILPTQAPLPE